MAAKKEAENQKDTNQVDTDVNQNLDQLVESLQSDLNSIAIEDALALIDQWQSLLSKSKINGGKELAAELKELQKLLKSDKSTGHEISEVLIQIGERTAEFSGEAEKGSKQTVQRLSKQLRSAGTSIAKAEDREMHEQLDTIVEKSEGDELTTLDPEQAVGAIDFWYNMLNKAEGEQYKEVANSLKSLKQALSRGNSKPETIAKALAHVGEQTAQIASEAPRGFKGVLQKVGRQLSSASESLAEEKSGSSK
ncbi:MULTISPECIES: hypothetical protein [unclassified Leptolyngbya]|uniref:hypothetical protein n=1 Tax=unclassified Leptolyngbya TaxID=2650499 RepID=UPI00168735CB|nr:MULTISPECIES: hypothetical protein [unclassified Leptolyngbya]MBD1910424.1 hypothetical protein [Leptolyngbya sp. FACHB-8]MBD2154192.1 hypothetical protein [Leptolyngbya sp. FACHB-16]